MKINVDLSNVQKVVATITDKGRRLTDNVDKAVEAGALHGKNVATDEAPRLTGALQDGIKVIRNQKFSYEVYATMPYSAIHEFGGVITLNKVVYIPSVGFRYVSTVTIREKGYMRKGEKAGVEKAQKLVNEAVTKTFK